jgi:hypothetical protein
MKVWSDRLHMCVQEGGLESNGAGKTALVMAPLWALTGSVDARSEVWWGGADRGEAGNSLGVRLVLRVGSMWEEGSLACHVLSGGWGRWGGGQSS